MANWNLRHVPDDYKEYVLSVGSKSYSPMTNETVARRMAKGHGLTRDNSGRFPVVTLTVQGPNIRTKVVVAYKRGKER